MKKIGILCTGLLLSFLLMGQEPATYETFDLFYVVNSTVGGRGLDENQIESLRDKVAEVKKTSSRVFLYVSDGPEPWTANNEIDHEAFVNKLYVTSTEYPLSHTSEFGYLTREVFKEKPFHASRLVRVHFFVPESFVSDVNRPYSILLDYLEQLSFIAGQPQMKVIFYSAELSRDDAVKERIRRKLTFFREGMVECEFVKP